MSEWTESTVRAAASWKAFKEGKALLDAGAVTEAAMGSSGWKGAVRQGKRILRVTVTAKSATDLDTRCPCPENQSTGALCPHAVAVALFSFAGGPAAKSSSLTAVPASVPTTPFEILLPENWRDSLVRGKLAASLGPAPSGGNSEAADRRLADWLKSQGGTPRGVLHLDGLVLASFLEAICDHSRVFEMKSRQAIEFRDGGRLELSTSSRAGDEVTLTPTDHDWFIVGESAWRVEDGNALVRLGRGPFPLASIGHLARGKSAQIPTAFLLDQLDGFQQWLHFPSDDWLENLHFIPERGEVELMLDGSLSQIEARPFIRYENGPTVTPGQGNVPGLPRLEGDRCHVRNTALETRVANRLHQAGFAQSTDSSGSWVLRGESEVSAFIGRSLPVMTGEWKIKESERFTKARKQCVIVSPKIEILGSGEDWLRFDLKFQTNDGSVIPVAEVRRMLRSSGGVTGRKSIVSNEISELIEPLFSELDLHQEHGHYRASLAVGELIQNLRKKINNSSNINDLNESHHFVKPASLQAELRGYQQQGFSWVWDRLSRFGGALLADDMGLGKTVQTIAVIERLFESASEGKGLVLVVATASLLGNWKAEFERFAPARGVRILHGSARDKEREKVVDGEVVLTSYSTLARDLAWHLRQAYRVVVVDEASLMRNPDTDHAKAVSKLNSEMRLALTGTPVENGVRDLWSIFRFIQPGWLGSREQFKELYEQSLQAGDGSVMERLRLKTSPFLLRRTKEQVAPELPSKIFIDELCDLSSDQQAVYRDFLVEGRKRVEALRDSGNQGAARMQVLTALLRLRQTCCDLALLGNERFNQMLVSKRSAKLQRLLELMEEAISGGHRMLVFSQFQTQLREIEKCIKERGWDSLRLDGQTRNRQDMVDRFQQADGPPIFLISLKAGGYGLNLTAADVVVHFDPWWNPAAEAQATDRAHRIGQTRPVTVYRLLTRGTVEEKVVRLQAKKRELASAIDESGAGDALGWSADDLAEVLKA